MSKLIIEVCRVDAIEKHPNADKLSIVTIKGWNCIVGLDQYSPGDLVIFCPPDCVIPNELIEQFNLEYLKKDGRVKTVKLRGYISQGLVLDMDCLPGAVAGTKGFHPGYAVGMDVAKKLGITKYEPPIRNQGSGVSRVTFKSLWKKYREKKISLRRLIAKTIGVIKDNLKPKKNPNPLFNKYTDIENIKNFNTVFKPGDLVVITEKIHGSNFRAGRLPRHTKSLWGKIKVKLSGKYEFIYGSHNVQKTVLNKKMGYYGEDVYGQIAKKYNLEEIIPEDYVIYGEIYGKRIQELEYGKKDIDVVFFDVKYKGKYLNWSDAVEFLMYRQLPIAPILFVGKVSEIDNDFSELTKGNSRLYEKQIREGCVVKTVKEEHHPRIGRKILKSINPEYLLKKNRTEHH